MKMVWRNSLAKWLNIHYSGNSRPVIVQLFLWVHTSCTSLYLLVILYCFSNGIMIFLLLPYTIACDVSLFPSVMLLSLQPTAALSALKSWHKLHFTPQMHLNSLSVYISHPFYFCA